VVIGWYFMKLRMQDGTHGKNSPVR